MGSKKNKHLVKLPENKKTYFMYFYLLNRWIDKTKKLLGVSARLSYLHQDKGVNVCELVNRFSIYQNPIFTFMQNFQMKLLKLMAENWMKKSQTFSLLETSIKQLGLCWSWKKLWINLVLSN